jgi:hypothetical protein
MKMVLPAQPPLYITLCPSSISRAWSKTGPAQSHRKEEDKDEAHIERLGAAPESHGDTPDLQPNQAMGKTVLGRSMQVGYTP